MRKLIFVATVVSGCAGSGSTHSDKLSIDVLGGSVLDERKDTIDFASGEPIHMHTGPEIALTATGCPAVYKYSYLMSALAPQYGREFAPNPLSWQFDVPGAKKVTYRVETDAGEFVTSAALEPDFDGLYTITLHREQIGEHAGIMRIQIDAVGAADEMATASVCWDHHPLAAPLHIDVARGELFVMSLLRDDGRIACMIDGACETNLDVADVHLVQYTAEPTMVAFTASAPATHFTKTVVDDLVPTSTGTNLACGTSDTGISTAPACSTAPVIDAADPTTSGSSIEAAFDVTVLDDLGALAPCHVSGLQGTCRIPARKAGEKALGYHFHVNVHHAQALAPAAGKIDGFTVAGLTYAGLAPVASAAASCSDLRSRYVPQAGTTVYYCVSWTEYTRIVALAHARVDFDPIGIEFQTGPDSIETFATESLAWDSGTDDLPGPQH